MIVLFFSFHAKKEQQQQQARSKKEELQHPKQPHQLWPPQC